MKSLLCCLLLLAGMFCTGIAEAQPDFPPVQRRLPELEGKKIYAVYTDSRNSLWAGTDRGLYCYDGFSTRHYTVRDGLEDNEVLEFWGEENGRLWLRTFTNRLCFVQLSTGIIFNSTQLPALKMNSPYVIRSVSIADGKLYAASDLGSITVIDLKHFSASNLPSFDWPRSIYADPVSGEVLVLGNLHWSRRHAVPARPAAKEETGLYRLYNGQWQQQCTNEELIRQCGDLHSRYWSHYFCAGKGIFSFSSRGVAAAPAPATLPTPGSSNHFKFFRFRHGISVIIFPDRFFICRNGECRTYLIPDVSGATMDLENNLWLSSLKDGLLFIPHFHDQIRQVRPPARSSYANLDVDTAGVHLFSDAGIQYDHSPQLELLRKEDLSGGRQVYTIMRSSNLTCVINREQNTSLLTVYTRHWSGGRQYTHSTNLRAAFKGMTIMGDTACIRTSYFTYRLYPQNNKVVRELMYQGRNLAMHEAEDGTLWFASLSHLHARYGKMTSSVPMPSEQPVRLLNTLGPYVLVSSGSNALLVYNRHTGRFARVYWPYDPEEFLEMVYDIDTERKFLKTNTNLYLLEWAENNFRLHRLEPPEAALPDISQIRTASNRVYFLTPKQCFSYPLDLLLRRKDPPSLRFSRLEYNTREEGKQQAFLPPGQSALVLPAGTRSYSLWFSLQALNHRGAAVEYAVTGTPSPVDADWRHLKENHLHVALPQYGRTYISLRSRSAASGYSAPLTLAVQVKWPFWYDYRFIAAIAAVLAAAVFFVARQVFRHYARKREARHAREMQLLQSEFRAYNAMMNPHFMFNSLNSIQSLINTDDKKAANRYLQIFSRLLRQNLSNINADLIPVQQELDLLKNYLEMENLRSDKPFRYELITRDDEVAYCCIPPLLIQPLVENAILHGLRPLRNREGQVQIAVARENGYVVIRVSDNGMGFRAQDHVLPGKTSLGLQYIRKRLEKIEHMSGRPCKLDIRSTVEGTLVTVVLPDDLE